ncbi:MAG: hypothetical protein H6Q99_3822 [Proteobacteria bacterium]|nr:hypothetical protein [Pseudomonadota bacterium]
MKTSIIAATAIALFALPTIASAAGLQYDPAASDDNNQATWVENNPAANPANAAAAKADAARYAAAATTDTSGAVIATHGDTGARIVTEVNPSSDSSEPLLVNRVIIENPANAAAAKADAARYPAPVYYSSESDQDNATVNFRRGFAG